MTKYKVYESETGEIQALQIGWSWMPFFFGSLWMLYKGLWIRGVFLLFLSALLAPTLIGLVIVHILLGAKGPSWVGSWLEKRDFVFKEVMEASNSYEAVTLFQSEQKKGKVEESKSRNNLTDGDGVERLKVLKRLYDAEILTESEFDQKKKEALENT